MVSTSEKGNVNKNSANIKKRYVAYGVLLMVGVLSPTESMSQITTGDTRSGAKATAKILGFTTLWLTKMGEESITQVPALSADGEIICDIALKAPDAAAKVKDVRDVSGLLTYDVRATSESSDSKTLTFSGNLKILLLVEGGWQDNWI